MTPPLGFFVVARQLGRVALPLSMQLGVHTYALRRNTDGRASM